MVGGYSTLTVDSQQLQELLPIARYALHEFVARQQQQQEGEADTVDTAASSSSLVILPPQLFQPEEQIIDLTPLIVSAQRQVVAGMNYKLTIAILHNNTVCLGGFQVTVWRQLSKELTVTNWGRVMNGNEMEVEFGEGLVDALRVQGGEIESEPEE